MFAALEKNLHENNVNLQRVVKTTNHIDEVVRMVGTDLQKHNDRGARGMSIILREFNETKKAQSEILKVTGNIQDRLTHAGQTQSYHSTMLQSQQTQLNATASGIEKVKETEFWNWVWLFIFVAANLIFTTVNLQLTRKAVENGTLQGKVERP